MTWEDWKTQELADMPTLKQSVLRLCKLAGTKFRVLDTLYACFPPHRTYLEPFGGTYLVLLNKQRSYIEAINDIDPAITALAYCFLFCPDDLLKAVAFELHSQGLVHFLRNFDDPHRSMLDLALQKLYLLAHTFSAKMYSFGYSLNTDRVLSISLTPETVMAIRHRLAKVHIFSEDFRLFLPRALKVKHGFIYADPPYTMTEQAKFYDHNFTRQDHLDLFDLLTQFDSQRVKWLLSYDKSPFIEDLYADFAIHEIPVPYSFNTSPTAQRVQTELLISNYEIAKQLPLKTKRPVSLESFFEDQLAEERT